MTAYQKAWKSMSTEDRIANGILCRFKTDENGYISKTSKRNKIMYKMFKFVFHEDLLDMYLKYAATLDWDQIDWYSYEAAAAEVMELKEAYNK